MKKATKIIWITLVSILATLGLFFVALIIYWWPVIDRVYVRPCHYYPHAFADCVQK